jgi:hypothetical protein
MAYSFIRLVQSYNDPVWGLQALPWIKTPLIRVYRNSLRKSVFEWVGNPKAKCDIEHWRRGYPIVIYDEKVQQDSPASFRKPGLP